MRDRFCSVVRTLTMGSLFGRFGSLCRGSFYSWFFYAKGLHLGYLCDTMYLLVSENNSPAGQGCRDPKFRN